MIIFLINVWLTNCATFTLFRLIILWILKTKKSLLTSLVCSAEAWSICLMIWFVYWKKPTFRRLSVNNFHTPIPLKFPHRQDNFLIFKNFLWIMQIFLYPPYHCKNKFIEQNFYNHVFIRIYDKFSKYNANFLIRGGVCNFHT